MAEKFKIFHGVGVVAAELKTNTLYSVMSVGGDPEAVDFSNHDLRFDLDLSRTPSRLPLAQWDLIEVDDRGIDETGAEHPVTPTPSADFNLPITGLGSGKRNMPVRGAFVAGVYVEHGRYEKLREAGKFPEGWPETGGGPIVQLTSITYESGKRFHGFIAEVTKVTADTIEYTLEKPDDGVKLTVRKGNPDDYILVPPLAALGATTALKASPAEKDHGAVFIELKKAVARAAGIKIPVGFEGLIGMRR